MTSYTTLKGSVDVFNYANVSSLPSTGLSVGDIAYVSDNNAMYVSQGTGWFKVATINENPNVTFNVSSVAITEANTSQTISYIASDPEGAPISLTLSNSVISNGSVSLNTSANTVTVTAGDVASTGNLTLQVSDGFNIASNTINFSISLQPARNFVTDNIVAFYDAQDTSSYSGSGSTWTNISGQSGDLTIYNSPTWNSNGYFTFNGSTQYMRNTNLFNMGIGETFTVEGFVFIPSSPSYFKVFSNDRLTTQGSEGWIDVEATTGKIRYGVDSRTSAPYVDFMSSGTSNINLNGWNYFSMTGNIGTTSMSGRLLINGAIENLSASVTWSGFTDQNYTQFSVGRHYNGGYSDDYFNHSISMIRLYNDQLTQAEQEQNFEDFLAYNSISFTYTT